MLKHLQEENLKELTSSGLVLVDFYATWCGPCKMLGPVLEELAEEKEELSIIKVDIDKHNDLAREYAIMSVPTMIIYKDGKVAKKLVGFMPKQALLKEINNI